MHIQAQWKVSLHVKMESFSSAQCWQRWMLCWQTSHRMQNLRWAKDLTQTHQGKKKKSRISLSSGTGQREGRNKGGRKKYLNCTSLSAAKNLHFFHCSLQILRSPRVSQSSSEQSEGCAWDGCSFEEAWKKFGKLQGRFSPAHGWPMRQYQIT